MSCWTCVVTVYAIGFLVTPFVWSLIDGWPFAKPRIDGCDGGATFFIALFWPLVLGAVLLVGALQLCGDEGARGDQAQNREDGA